MIHTASLFTNNDTPVTSSLLLYVLWPSLIAAAVVVILPMLLLSFDNLIDTDKPLIERLNRSPLASVTIWALFCGSIGFITFGTVFIGQLLMYTTAMDVYASLASGLGITVALVLIVSAMTLGAVVYWRRNDDLQPAD